MDTVGRPEVERHEFVAEVFSKFGIDISADNLIRPIYTAETEFPGCTPYRWDESKDPECFLRYVETILSNIGKELDRETVFQVMKVISSDSKKLGFNLYDDVLPTMRILKNNGLILGLITSMKGEINNIARRLGLEPYLDFTITSSDVKAPKPEAPVFLAALEHANARASDAIYVGDQYSTDVIGARRVGINPVLLDRYDLFPDTVDCLRIRNPKELPNIIW